MWQTDSSYLTPLLGGHKQLEQTVRAAIYTLRRKVNEFDAIAFRGMSGALIAPLLTMALKKHLILVRKHRDMNHSGRLIEGLVHGNFRYIIVDDMIDSGQTVRQIQQTIHILNRDARITGIYLYCSDSWIDPDRTRETYWFYGPACGEPGCVAVELRSKMQQFSDVEAQLAEASLVQLAYRGLRPSAVYRDECQYLASYMKPIRISLTDV